MSPFERLRYLARASGEDAETLVEEAADCLAGFGDDPMGVVMACRRSARLPPHGHASCGGCARSCSRRPIRPRARGPRGGNGGATPHPARLAGALPFPHEQPVAVLGWPDVVRDGLAERIDLELLAVRNRYDDSLLSRRLRMSVQSVRVIDEMEISRPRAVAPARRARRDRWRHDPRRARDRSRSSPPRGKRVPRSGSSCRWRSPCPPGCSKRWTAPRAPSSTMTSCRTWSGPVRTRRGHRAGGHRRAVDPQAPRRLRAGTGTAAPGLTERVDCRRAIDAPAPELLRLDEVRGAARGRYRRPMAAAELPFDATRSELRPVDDVPGVRRGDAPGARGLRVPGVRLARLLLRRTVLSAPFDAVLFDLGGVLVDFGGVAGDEGAVGHHRRRRALAPLAHVPVGA